MLRTLKRVRTLSTRTCSVNMFRIFGTRKTLVRNVVMWEENSRLV